MRLFFVYFKALDIIGVISNSSQGMLSNILTLLFALVIILLPMMFWMYVYTSFSSQQLSRKYFLSGIIVGGISAGIFVFQQQSFISYFFQNIFYHLTLTKESFLGIPLGVSLGKLFVFFTGIGLVVGFVSMRRFSKKYVLIFGRSLLLFLGLIFAFSVLSYVFSQILEIQKPGIETRFGDYSFVFLGTIVGYYIVISLLEEGMKYFGILASSGTVGKSSQNLEYFALVSVSVGLGFSLFETIFYGYQYYIAGNNGVDLLRLMFFRSIFISCVHIFCSLLIAVGFWYILYGKNIFIGSVKSFSIFSVLGILSHVFFDLSITYGYVPVIFLYAFGLYIFMSYFFTQDKGLADTQSL